MNSTSQYDYIIAGMGCAGLSLAIHISENKTLAGKKILLVDRGQKNTNDRTWCFWEKEKGLFEGIVHKEWKQVCFASNSFQKTYDTDPYTYKMIRGIDFYKHCIDHINLMPNFSILHAEVADVFTSGKGAGVKLVNGEFIEASIVFSSIVPESINAAGEVSLLQHFKGWRIGTESAVFDASIATIMDFRTGQEKGTTFCYVLPITATEALVEHTIFSKKVAEAAYYERELKEYITTRFGIQSYRIIEEEFGVIPMTDRKFPKRNGNIIYIGTAGGQTKGSSGYTFRFIQKHSASLVRELAGEGKVTTDPGRFLFYDSVLLRVLENGSVTGEEIFSKMFQKNDLQAIFRFLDNESDLQEEIGIISTLPTLPFLKAAVSKFF